jgi:3-keto-disaccharide hydrolase
MGNSKDFVRMSVLNTLTGCTVGAWLAGCTTRPAESFPTPPAAPAAVAATNSPVQKQEPEQPDPGLKKLAETPVTAFEGEGWQSLFDGRTLTGWQETKFSGHGETVITDGMILLKMGDPFTGIGWTNDFPKMNYEIALDASRVSGADFFCGMTVPVGDSFCSLIVGGWGGALVGISSLDGMDASENETSKYVTFQQSRWYRIRMRVTEGRIEAWIDREKLVDVVTTGKKISLRPGEIEESKPFGIACWQTTAALREIKMRRVSEAADKPKKY